MVTSEYLFRRLREDTYFSKIDLSIGYWQIPVAENDIHKLPFGMVKSAATLVRAIWKLGAGLDNVM